MKDLRVPAELRGLFKRPWGKLYKGEGLGPALRIRSDIAGEDIIVVGDVTLKNVKEVGIKPKLAIVDLKTKRENEMEFFGETLVVDNPPGTISRELWEAIHENIDKEGVTILVRGEEDLAVLPCILESDWNTVILYGQPDEGIVLVRVDEDKKMKASMVLKMLPAGV